jgi:hypothetical protein
MRPLLLIVVLLATSNCAFHDDLQASEKVYVVKQIVTDDWCRLEGKAVNGWAKMKNGYYEICVSLNSDMPARTLDHELSHIALHSLGLNPLVLDW